MLSEQTDATRHGRDPLVSTLRGSPPRQPADKAGDERLIDLGCRDPPPLEPSAEDRRGSDVTAYDAGRVPAGHQDVDEVVYPLAQRSRPDLLADSSANGKRFKHGLLLGPRDGTRRRPRVLCQAHRDADTRYAGGNGAPQTVTGHNAALVMLTCMSIWTYPSLLQARQQSGAASPRGKGQRRDEGAGVVVARGVRLAVDRGVRRRATARRRPIERRCLLRGSGRPPSGGTASSGSNRCPGNVLPPPTNSAPSFPAPAASRH